MNLYDAIRSAFPLWEVGRNYGFEVDASDGGRPPLIVRAYVEDDVVHLEALVRAHGTCELDETLAQEEDVQAISMTRKALATLRRRMARRVEEACGALMRIDAAIERLGPEPAK